MAAGYKVDVVSHTRSLILYDDYAIIVFGILHGFHSVGVYWITILESLL
jgi:hypothetical protein